MVLAVPPLWVLSPPLPYRVCCCPVLSEATALLVYYQLMQPQRNISTSGFVLYGVCLSKGWDSQGWSVLVLRKHQRIKKICLSSWDWKRVYFLNSDSSGLVILIRVNRQKKGGNIWTMMAGWIRNTEHLIFQFQAINRDKKQAVLQRVDQIVCCLLKKWGLTVFNSWRTCSSTPSFKKDSLTFFITSSMTDLYNFGWKWNAHQFYPNFSQIPIKQTKNTYHWIWSWHAL